jgi:hypothetical protein
MTSAPCTRVKPTACRRSPTSRLNVLEPWDHFWMEAREFIEVGDTMVVVSTQRGRLKGMKNVIDRPCVDNWTFRDGRIVLHEAYLEREEALRSARSRERDRAESS